MIADTGTNLVLEEMSTNMYMNSEPQIPFDSQLSKIEKRKKKRKEKKRKTTKRKGKPRDTECMCR